MSRRPIQCDPRCASFQKTLPVALASDIASAIDEYRSRSEPISEADVQSLEEQFVQRVGKTYEHPSAGEFPSLRQASSSEIGEFAAETGIGLIEADGWTTLAAIYGMPVRGESGYIPFVVGIYAPDWAGSISAHMVLHDFQEIRDLRDASGPVLTGTIDEGTELGTPQAFEATERAISELGGAR
jgi:hypothetical protein